MTTNNKQPATNVLKTKPNKAKVNIGKINISIARIKDYDKNNEQSTTNIIKTKPNKANLKRSDGFFSSRCKMSIEETHLKAG